MDADPRRGTVRLTQVPSRPRRSLDGAWRTIVDPYDTGYTWILGGRNPYGWFLDRSPRHEGDLVEYDFDTSPVLEVPGDWGSQREELRYYEGVVWYRRRFTATESSDRRTFCHFGAVNQRCVVFLDGEELAAHEGGFSPFAVELTGRLGGEDEHTLIVRVDATRRPEGVPALKTDWWNDGGITRSVELVEVPRTFLRDAWLTMAPDGRLVGGVTADGPVAAEAEVRVSLPALGWSVQLTTDATGRAQLHTAAPDGLERWHVGAPVHHEVRWELVGHDQLSDRVGFRTVAVDGDRILVNDRPVFAKGISLHAEAPGRPGRAHGPDDAARALDWAQRLGANFVRLAHYQHDEHIVREADRRGLLTWCELPVYWGLDFGSEVTRSDALHQLESLIVRDRSRANVILWSVANETPITEERTAFLAGLADRARELDPTRLVTAALVTLPEGETEHVVDDPLGEVVDVIGVNQYLGWYYAAAEDVPAHSWRTSTGKPLIFSELGAGARQGLRGPRTRRWTEDFQDAVYEAQLAMLGRVPGLAGLSPWILHDFRTPMRTLPGIQDGWNRKGLISDRGIPKLAFERLRAHYATLDDEGHPRH